MPLTFWTLVVGKWAFGDGLVCQIHGFVDVFSTYCPPATMGLTAFNRYIRIVKTNHYRKIFSPFRSKLWLFCTWFSLASYLLVARITDWQRYDFVVGFAACSVEHYTENRRLFHYCFVVSVYFGISFSVAIFSYYKVIKAIRKHHFEVGPSLYSVPSTSQAPRISIQEIKISKSIAFVLAGFLLCLIPMWGLSLTNRFSTSPVPRIIPLLVTFFVFLSSSINPLIYAATNNAFRQEFRKMVCRFKRRTVVGPAPMRAGTFVENIKLNQVPDNREDFKNNVTYVAILKVSTTAS